MSKLDLAILLDFAREWDKFQEIPQITLTFSPYAQGGRQEHAIQWTSPQRLNMKVLGNQSHTN